jgi:hypothetical protein
MLMAKSTRTLQPVDKCRWSVPACWHNPLSVDDNEFESYWLCELNGVAVPVTPAECASCEHWTPDPERAAVVKRPRH